MANKYTFDFAPKAFADLEGILSYIEKDLSNSKAAEDLATKLFNEIDLICEFPNMGREVDNEYIFDQSLRKIFLDNYIMFYKADETIRTIIIVRIVYGKRNIEEILKTI